MAVAARWLLLPYIDETYPVIQSVFISLHTTFIFLYVDKLQMLLCNHCFHTWPENKDTGQKCTLLRDTPSPNSLLSGDYQVKYYSVYFKINEVLCFSFTYKQIAAPVAFPVISQQRDALRHVNIEYM